MSFFAVLVSACLILWAMVRWPLVNRFVAFLQPPVVTWADLPLPKVAIILCLRGSDPFLAECLTALLDQSYPHYELQIVVDSQQDPAWEIVMQTLHRHPPTNPATVVQVQPLQVKYTTASLKCQALIQAISQLNPDIAAIAILDADIIPYPNWLEDLVKPLGQTQHDRTIGATTGYRWYVPENRHWGAWFRYVGNAISVAQMSVLPPAFPWGGCCALSMAALRQANLLDHWQRTLSDDTMMDVVFRTHDIQIQPIPWLMMLNCEDIDLNCFFSWVQRQLIMAKLYSDSWRWMVIGTVINLILQLVAIGGFAVACWTQQWHAAILLSSGLIGYGLILLWLLIRMEKAVRQVVQHQGEELPNLSIRAIAQLALVILPTQWVVGIALCLTYRVQQIQWRGITYYLNDGSNLHFEYQQYQPSSALTDSPTSIF
jgi:glycosyltransferase involved in cell wall biosynthesis